MKAEWLTQGDCSKSLYVAVLAVDNIAMEKDNTYRDNTERGSNLQWMSIVSITMTYSRPKGIGVS